eukprot:COSAG02_NODE_29778_length_563_cov_0.885776_1_plen_71_part_10
MLGFRDYIHYLSHCMSAVQLYRHIIGRRKHAFELERGEGVNCRCIYCFFNDPATSEIFTLSSSLSLLDALP